MKKILIVDDQLANLQSLKMLLKYSDIKGITVVTAQSLDDGKALLSKRGIDLVLCDVVLDNDYGPDLKKLFPKVPFVYLTGDMSWKSPDKSPVLHKPYDHAELFKLIRTTLGLSESLRESLFRLTRLIANQDVTVAEVVKSLLEVAPPGWSGTVKAMKDKKGFSNKKAFSLAWSMHKRGAKPNYAPEAGKPKYKKPD